MEKFRDPRENPRAEGERLSLPRRCRVGPPSRTWQIRLSLSTALGQAQSPQSCATQQGVRNQPGYMIHTRGLAACTTRLPLLLLLNQAMRLAHGKGTQILCKERHVSLGVPGFSLASLCGDTKTCIFLS